MDYPKMLYKKFPDYVVAHDEAEAAAYLEKKYTPERWKPEEMMENKPTENKANEPNRK